MSVVALVDKMREDVLLWQICEALSLKPEIYVTPLRCRVVIINKQIVTLRLFTHLVTAEA